MLPRPKKPRNSPRPPAKDSVAALKKEADRWHSLATRYRFATRRGETWFVNCVTCGVEKPLTAMQCGHFQSRRFNSTRFSELNTAPQCVGCNMFKSGEQYKFSLFIDDLYGPGSAQRLVRDAQAIHQFTRAELHDIIESCKNYITYTLTHK